MPIYQYQCNDNACDGLFEAQQSFKDAPLKECPFCGGRVFRVLSPPTVFVKEVKTVAQLAENNTKKMGTYELEDRRYNDKVNSERARETARQQLEAKIPGASVIRPSRAERPWYRPDRDTPDANLAKMTPEQTKSYIMEGKK